MNSAASTRLADLIDNKARAAELTSTLLGSSNGGGLAVYDAALARLDLELARLAELAEAEEGADQ